MPEFEETNHTINPEHSYTPSADAKPRTRRRSGGFKKDYSTPNPGNIGEIDPTEALKSEKLSGGSKPAPAAKESKPAPKAAEKKPRSVKPTATEARPEASGTPQPSAETLAAIGRVEARIAERKSEREVKQAERKKAQAERKKESKPEARKSPAKKPAGKPQAPAKTGLFASILKLFGLGPKEPAKPASRNGNRNQRQGGRPQGKGGNRNNQNRQGGQNRGGQNRRRKGGNGQNRRKQGGGQRRQPAAARSEA
ncbi:hypothetical protein [Coraliomargarita akajimensis]|uniref:Uncharacterized protein n=1 Tax=Coraliomargarita akajimensis (strain DSM 45221 / IAM 15411 / JCM 23193 / KCTC 12865 / 04OKA010-24) TaxID=583355 RepID=D5EKR4_CORAD|nr:hypothetical protein [Coraliomargarita akajimensis]ADE54971.1 hypothetical protein Caka_1953 [Coraliomargarita akajimensis DSM 45221]